MFAKLKQFQEEREEGFTLIELLVVILIIGILSAIAIPAFLNQRKSAVDSSVQSDVSNAAKQIETWVVKQGATSTSLPAGLTIDATVNPVTVKTTTAGDIDKVENAVLKQIKASDGTKLVITGNSFSYTILGTNTGGDKAVAGFTYKSDLGGIQK